MIIKKEANGKITVYMDDTPTHARKLVYSKERNEKGKYVFERESDLNCAMTEPPADGRSIVVAELTNRVNLHGYIEMTQQEFETDFEQV